MPYLLESSLILAVLMALYMLLIKQQSMQKWKRSSLLFAIGFSLLAPTITIDTKVAETSDAAQVFISSQDLSEITIATLPQETFQMNWMNVYYFGMVVMLLIFVWKLSQIVSIIRNHPKEDRRDYTLVKLSGGQGTFSFFRWLFWDENFQADEKEQTYLLAHEESHIKLGHSYDIILAEAMQIVFWFNPFVFLLKNELMLVHELQADEEASASSLSQKEDYVKLLLRNVIPDPQLNLAHSFFGNPIKIRIRTLLAKTRRFNVHRWWPMLPVIALLFTFVACEKNLLINQDAAEMNVNIDSGESVYAIDEVFEVVEDQPSPIGGMQAFYKFIGANLEYPVADRAAGRQGKVFVQFVVSPDSVLVDVKAVKGVSPEIDAEAVRVLQSSPKWKPGMQRGKAVPVRMILPITFKLDGDAAVNAAFPKEIQLPLDADKEGIFERVEVQPKPQGGMKDFYEYVGEHLKYPASAKEDGKVFLQYVVSATGQITDVKVAKGLTPELNQAAMDVMKASPPWSPGLANGKAVPVKMILPISFQRDKRGSSESTPYSSEEKIEFHDKKEASIIMAKMEFLLEIRTLLKKKEISSLPWVAFEGVDDSGLQEMISDYNEFEQALQSATDSKSAAKTKAKLKYRKYPILDKVDELMDSYTKDLKKQMKL